MEAQLNMIKKETQDYTSRCSAEAKKMLEDIQLADHDVDIMEREAAEVLKVISWFLFFFFNNQLNLKCLEFFKMLSMYLSLSLLCFNQFREASKVRCKLHINQPISYR